MSGISPESVQLSRQFFMDEGSYGPFDLTSDFKKIVGCIEPRDQADTVHGEYKTIIQTAGGGAGEALDAAIAATITEGVYVSPARAIEDDKEARPLTVLGVHYNGCAFMTHMDAVTDEMAEPSDLTRDSVEQWAGYFNQRDHVAATLGVVTSAAAVQVEEFRGHDHNAELIPHVDDLYPHHANVMSVRGPSMSRVYVTNLHPHVGKDRNRKPRDPAEAIKIQGYHDSLAASVNNLREANRLTNEARGLRLTAMLLRSAAARTVITQGKLDEFTFIEVAPGDAKSGLKIARIAL